MQIKYIMMVCDTHEVLVSKRPAIERASLSLFYSVFYIGDEDNRSKICFTWHQGNNYQLRSEFMSRKCSILHRSRHSTTTSTNQTLDHDGKSGLQSSKIYSLV